MGSVIETVREPSKITSGGSGSVYDGPGINEVAIATVGYEEDELQDRWVSFESGQVLVEVTMRTGNVGQRSRVRVAAGVAFQDLRFGEQVAVALVGGNDVHGIIFARLNSLAAPVPATVAGIDTGVGASPQRGDQAAGPMFSFFRGRDGRLLAIETGALADLVVHSGASVELAGEVIHLSGLVHIGASFTSSPVPPTIGVQELPDTGAGVGVLPGVPGVPFVPTPGGNPTLPPYVGPMDGIVRAKDLYQSCAPVDAAYWLYQVGLDTFVMALSTFVVAISSLNPAAIAAAKVNFDIAQATFTAIPKPVSLTSAAMTASLCTAADGL